MGENLRVAEKSGVRNEDVPIERSSAGNKLVRTPAKTFRDLLVRQRAHHVVLLVYGFTAGFPQEERYGLSSQLRRAAVSIPANIAEGFRKPGRADKARFMNMAEGSIEEVRYYIILANDLHYGKAAALMDALEVVSRLLNAYSTAILTSDS